MADMRKEISERFKKCRNKEKISARRLAHVLVSEETLKGYADDSIRQKIGKIERGTTDPEPIILKAYCKHFGVTSDYLLGIRDVKTTNEDIAMIGNNLPDKSVTITTDRYVDFLHMEKGREIILKTLKRERTISVTLLCACLGGEEADKLYEEFAKELEDTNE